MNMKMIIPMVMIAAMPMGADAQNKSGLVMSNLDKTTKPADDFYQFATGGWQKNNPLPAAYSRYGSFEQLQENNNKRINSILGELQKKSYKKGSIEQKLSDFYKLAIDVDRRNKEGIAPRKASARRDSCCPNQGRPAEIADQVCLDGTRSKLWCWFRCRREECHSEHLQSLAGRPHPWRQGLLPQQRCRHCGHP